MNHLTADQESTRPEWEAEGFSFQKSVLPWKCDSPTRDLVRLRADGVYESLDEVEPFAPHEVIELGPVQWAE